MLMVTACSSSTTGSVRAELGGCSATRFDSGSGGGCNGTCVGVRAAGCGVSSGEGKLVLAAGKLWGKGI